ncbi:MAG: cyclic pyranopterin monophosphate synthase MoaC [Phyllobacterium sp.]
MTSSLTHLDQTGAANMVDVGDKSDTKRIAIAEGWVQMQPETLAAILAGDAAKGDVIGTARIAGIMAAKKTHELIPLCHPLLLNKIAVDIKAEEQLPGLHIQATAGLTGKTGVEMEALTAVSVTCLTIYDMAKAIDKGMTISGIRLISKSGGKSGDWSVSDTRGARHGAPSR